jgi:ribosome biogenesis protein MAK21
MYLNLLFRALRDDLNLKRVKAFVKRLIQTLTLHQPPFICGVLYLIKHLEDVFPSILSMTRQPELRGDNEDEEIFHDVDDTADVTDKIPSPKIASPNASVKKNIYDGKKRDPEYSGAEYSCLWELVREQVLDQRKQC